MNRLNVLTIGGSDPSLGAGIQGDIRTIFANGCSPLAVVSALTCQSEEEVFGIERIDREFFLSQLNTIFSSQTIHSIKIGMLYDESIVDVVSEFLRSLNGAIPIILDPVLSSTSGKKLLSKTGSLKLIDNLLRLSTVVTPNIPEAEELTRESIRTKDDMISAATSLRLKGAKAVLIKGGHLPNSEESPDLLLDSTGSEWLRGVKIKGDPLHGTGCAMSSAIACKLAAGYSLLEAALEAKAYVTGAIKSAKDLGFKSVDHFWERREKIPQRSYSLPQKAEEELQL